MDSGTTNNITGELEKLTIRDKYAGGEQVHTATRQVWRLLMLVIAFCIPLVVRFILTMFYMFHKQIRVLFPYTVLQEITMLFLKFIPTISLSRNW